ARADIAAERALTGVQAPRVEASHRSTIEPVAPPTAPYWGARRVKASLRDVWRYLDRNSLFRHHWGGYRAAPGEYDRIVAERFEPLLERLQAEALRDGWLQALIVSGYFAARANGNQLVLSNDHGELARLEFPRQPDGERLCLADYFGDDDVAVLQAVSAGRRASAYVEHLQREVQFERMLYANGLASATAEALAEFAHAAARPDLGLPDERSLRFSWGYPACPDLEEQ